MYPKTPNKDEMISNIYNSQQNNHIQVKSHNHKNKLKYVPKHLAKLRCHPTFTITNKIVTFK